MKNRKTFSSGVCGGPRRPLLSGDKVLFGENSPNEGESPDDKEEVPLLEKDEGKGVEGENRGEGKINIEKVEMPDDMAKEIYSPAPESPAEGGMGTAERGC